MVGWAWVRVCTTHFFDEHGKLGGLSEVRTRWTTSEAQHLQQVPLRLRLQPAAADGSDAQIRE